jgi:exodeoxyribonuclease VII large subunit
MSGDLFGDSAGESASARSGSPRVFKISEITRDIREMLETGFGSVWVEGEVSNYRKQASGHQYFTLKDGAAQLACVWFARPPMWRKQVPLSDGMHVQARGSLTVYEARGQYQLNVQLVHAGGAGLLQAKFEALKRKLDAEGLFDSARKRTLPRVPSSIAIVTSPTGAALRDMLNILSRRAPWVRLIISPVRVQGAGASLEIADAIGTLNAFGEAGLVSPEVIVVARGGGSAEDLWEFNDELLARAIVASRIPVISAVGHEIDFTIADFVADLRAPTPSAAAELVVPDTIELVRGIEQLAARGGRCLRAAFERSRGRLQLSVQNASFREPSRRVAEAMQRADLAREALERTASERMTAARRNLAELLALLRQHRPDQVLELRRHELATRTAMLHHRLQQAVVDRQRKVSRVTEMLRVLAPEATLARGYSITTTESGKVISSIRDVQAGNRVRTQFRDGIADAEVVATHAIEPGSP